MARNKRVGASAVVLGALSVLTAYDGLDLVTFGVCLVICLLIWLSPDPKRVMGLLSLVGEVLTAVRTRRKARKN